MFFYCKFSISLHFSYILFLVVCKKLISFWNVPEPMLGYEGHIFPVQCFCSLHTFFRAILATASEDNTVRLWGRPNKLKRDSGKLRVPSLSFFPQP